MGARIYLDGKWHEIPRQGGIICGTGLEAKWLDDRDGEFSLRKLVLVNKGEKPARLGACHLFEEAGLPDFSSEDRVYLDSGGGWPSGCIKVKDCIRSKSYEAEYWKQIFLPEEDIQWARETMGVENLALGVPGANYSFGGMAAVQHREYGMVYAFTAPMKRCNCSIFVLCDPETGELKGLALSCNFAGYELKPGEHIESEETAIARFASAQRGLEEWADMSARRSNIQLRHRTPPVGWLSWYGYRLTIDAEEIKRVADFINKTYSGFGFKYMQIDLGYSDQNVPGRWDRTNERFPEGLAKFAEDMRERGFVPGIWCSMYDVEEGTVEAGAMPEKFKWFWEPHCPICLLDPTHPAVKEYVSKTLRYFKSLGIEYFKIDFINRMGRVDGVYQPYDKSTVRGAQAYRTALKNMLAEMDDTDFFYACSNLTMHSIGLCSTSMSACDIGNTGIRENPAKLAFFKEQFTSTMSRYFVQNKLIMLTADSINIAPPADLEEARMRVLFVGLSGGQIFIGDKFQEASEEVLDLVRRVLPPYGRAAAPVDLFAGDTPEIFRLDTPERTIYSFFNFEEERTMRLKLPDDREYDVWNFFEQRYEGRAKKTFEAKMPRASARVFAFTPVSASLRVIGTSFHFTCGAVELSQVQGDEQHISGYLRRPAGDNGKIFIANATGKIRTIELTGNGGDFFWTSEL